MVDVVTERRTNMHQELLARFASDGPAPPDAALYAAYGPASRDQNTELDVWYIVLAPGAPLPMLPLFLRGGFRLPVELEQTHERTVHDLRIPVNGLARAN
jgi:hypothetical protein